MIHAALILHYEPDGWRIYDPTIRRDIPNAQGTMTFAHAWQAIACCYPHHYTFEIDTAKVSNLPTYQEATR
jgi:hypothetical protein